MTSTPRAEIETPRPAVLPAVLLLLMAAVMVVFAGVLLIGGATVNDDGVRCGSVLGVTEDEVLDGGVVFGGDEVAISEARVAQLCDRARTRRATWGLLLVMGAGLVASRARTAAWPQPRVRRVRLSTALPDDENYGETYRGL